MPRVYRIDWKNCLHHVMMRGIEKTEIFRSDHDRRNFVDRLGRCIEQTHVAIMAWALMPNHVHMLVRTGDIPLHKFMHRLLTGHAVYFNKRYDRAGHLFQNRYISILVQTETYMMRLVRYIHRNPLKAKIVRNMDTLDSYPWTGHAGVLHAELYLWQDRATVLKEINVNNSMNTDSYAEFMSETDDEINADIPFDKGSYLLGSEGIRKIDSTESGKSGTHVQFRVLGDRDYAKEVYDKLTCTGRGKLRSRVMEHNNIDLLLDHISSKWSVSRRILTSGIRRERITRAREYASYALVSFLGLRLNDCGKILNITPEAVRQSVGRFIESHDCQAVCAELEDFFK